MTLYENVFIARQDLAATQVNSLMESFSAVMRDQGGNVSKTEYCGLRTLAYPIRKNKKGHYCVMNITAPAAAVAEMERVMRLNEDLLRHLTVTVDAHEAGPSAILKSARAPRDDYEGGDDRGYRSSRPPRHSDNDRNTTPSETTTAAEETE